MITIIVITYGIGIFRKDAKGYFKDVSMFQRLFQRCFKDVKEDNVYVHLSNLNAMAYHFFS